VYRASWPEEKIVRAPLGQLVEKIAGAGAIERTALILVGRALGAEDFRESALYDASYQRRYRGRPE
jgi:precorrin-4/cobalt-precorrin-4 C11-methyltransferase